MIKILSRSEINHELWDACIEKSKNGQIFGYTWYLDCCCPGWKGIVKNNYEAVFPIASKNKFGINYLYQPFFTRHFGIYSPVEILKEDVLEFLKTIPSNYRYWDFCLNNLVEEVPKGILTTKKIYQELNLNQDYLEIRKSYHENLIRNLKKAEKENFQIIENYDPELVFSQFKIHQKEKQLGFDENDFNTLNKITNSLKERNRYKCLGIANSEGTALAGAFFMETNDRIVYLKGFTSSEGKKCGAMHFLFDFLIHELSNKRKVLDFGGSNVESVARFYKGFGAKDCLYLHLQLNRLPSIIKWLKR